MTTKPNRHPKKRLSLSRRLQFSSAAAIGFGLVAMVALDILLLPLVMKIPRELYLMGFIAAIPGQGIKSESQGVRINSLGMTGTTPSGPKWENEIRILTLGGSVMMNRNMTERLEAKLNAASSQEVQILGAGLSGHDTRSSVIKFDYLARYDFDYVLIYHGINDLWNNHVAPDEFRIDYSHRCPWNRRNVILDNSLLCRLAFNGWPRTKPQTVVNGSGFKSAEILSKNLGDLIHKIRAKRSTPILLTFAWLLPDGYTPEKFKAGQLGYSNPERHVYTPAHVWGPPAYVEEGLQRHNASIRQLAKENDVYLIDTEQKIPLDLKYFGDVCHFSDEGVERFIHEVVEFFRTNQLISFRKI